MLETKIDHNFQKNLITAIKNERDIIFLTYSAIDDTEEKIKFALVKILEKYNKQELFTPIFSCIKELIANAIKANAKKLLFDEGKIHNTDKASEMIKQLRSILNAKALLQYGIKCKEKKLSTRIYLKIQNNNLSVEVINNIPLTEKELKRILERVEQSSKYDNIAEFYLENPDPEAEGMGLGLSMIVVLLKNIDISYKNFTVVTKNNKTYAKIVIPLN
ncbi:hypothetical protein ACFL20_00520 [Spirochaetota bacterium]